MVQFVLPILIGTSFCSNVYFLGFSSSISTCILIIFSFEFIDFLTFIVKNISPNIR